MTDLKVHPVADLFPMLAADELAELAADIKARGQLHPIVLDAEGRILDGRNRFAACELAGVIPRYVDYDGDDPDGYALAVNGQRREMTKAQKAIVAANFSKLEKFGDQRKAARALGVTDSRVSEAKVIVEHPDLTDLVLAGTRPFSKALEEARERDRRAAQESAAKDRLRAAAADLLALVDEERMSLGDAIAALDARAEQARQEEHAKSVERARDIDLAHNAAKVIVPELQARVASIAIGAEHGEPRLIDKRMVAELRDAVDVLEGLL